MKSTARLRSFLLGSTTLAILGSTAAQAAGPYYWDNDAAAGFGSAGGTWSATTAGSIPGWNTDSTGTTAPGSVTTGTGDALNFGSATNNLGAGTITVGTVSSGNMTFASGSGAIALSGGTITLAATQTTTVNNTPDTIGSILAGAATSFTKAGNGTLTLTGANTYTGATNVNQGTLAIASTGSLGNNSATSLNGGGTLAIASGVAGRTLSNNLVLNGGTLQGGIQDNIGSGGTIAINGTNVTHTFTTSSTLTLPGTVTASELIVGGGGGGGGGKIATAFDAGGGGGQVRNLTGQSLSSGAVTVGGGGAGTFNANGGDGTSSVVGGNTAIGGKGATVSPTTGKGGASGSGNAGGTKNGTAAGGGGGDSAAGSNAPSGGATGGAGGAGSVGTITGLTYGGGGGGRAQTTQGAGGAGGGGAGGVVGTANTGGGGGGDVDGGSGLVVVQYGYNANAAAGTLTLAGSIDLQTASTLDAYQSGGLVDVTGVIGTTTGTGGLGISSSNTAGGVVQYSNAMTYAGDTTINGGATLRLNVAAALPSGINKGNIVLNGGATAGTLDLNNFDASINGLNGTTGAVLGQVVNNNSATQKLLTVGNNDANGTFAGIIRDNTSGSGTIALTKTGTGTQTLSGANTYTGTTTISGGKLIVNGDQTSATGQTTVAAGTVANTPVATLSGIGTIGGSVSLTAQTGSDKNGGVLSPTAAADGNALTVKGATTFGSGSIFGWNMAAADPTVDPGATPNPGSYGQLAGTGAISSPGDAVFSIILGSGTFSDTFWSSNKTWNNVFSGTTTNLSAIFNSFSGDGVSASGNVAQGSFTFSGPSTLNYTFSAVPEPTSALAGLLIAAGLLRRRRR